MIHLNIKRIGICFNPFKEEFLDSFDEIKGSIEKMGFEIVFSCDITTESSGCFNSEKIDLLIAFGGDGTVLKAFHSVNFKVPVMGINFGKLGFLTHYHPEDIEQSLLEIKKGDFKFVDIPIYEVYHNTERFMGINDIVVSKIGTKILDISLKIDGYELGRIPADGIVVCTSLGSTAYNLSNGGSILSPKCGKVFEISFLAPHVMTARPIVVDGSEEITITTHQKDSKAHLVIDGIEIDFMNTDDTVKVSYSSKTAKLLTSNKKNFYELLKQKIGWGKR
ncbi:MAG: kinase [Thermotogaceae bacterium]|nr:kinase [Thermotogaceae bacterium]